MSREISLVQHFKAVPPVDVVGLIRGLGIEYREASMPPDQSGFFARHRDRYVIGVNSSDGPQRRRFTAAHELGHFMLHRDLLPEGQHFDRLYGEAAKLNPYAPFRRSHEIQANQFAADLLMPAPLVAARYRASRDVGEVANTFGVSQAAAEIRLKNLGLL